MVQRLTNSQSLIEYPQTPTKKISDTSEINNHQLYHKTGDIRPNHGNY